MQTSLMSHVLPQVLSIDLFPLFRNIIRYFFKELLYSLVYNNRINWFYLVPALVLLDSMAVTTIPSLIIAVKRFLLSFLLVIAHSLTKRGKK